MRKSILVSIIIFLNFRLSAQTTAQSNASAIAQKMKDSLALTDPQKDLIYGSSINLESSKIYMQQRYAGSSNLKYYLSELEKNRDSTYKSILPGDKYLLYRSKKANLIN